MAHVIQIPTMHVCPFRDVVFDVMLFLSAESRNLFQFVTRCVFSPLVFFSSQRFSFACTDSYECFSGLVTAEQLEHQAE